MIIDNVLLEKLSSTGIARRSSLIGISHTRQRALSMTPCKGFISMPQEHYLHVTNMLIEALDRLDKIRKVTNGEV